MKLIAQGLINPEDFKKADFAAHIDALYAMMRIRRLPDGLYLERTDRVSFFERTRVEAYKNWEIPWALVHSNLAPGSRCIDCGCGRSTFPVYLAQSGFDTAAVDLGTQKAKFRKKLNRLIQTLWKGYREDEAAAFKRISKRFDVSIDFKRESIEKMSFPSDRFDAVFCISVLEHIERHTAVRCFHELYRIVKPGGRLIVTVDFHPASHPNNAYTTDEINTYFFNSELLTEKPSPLDLHALNWDFHLSEINRIFGKNNLHSTFGMVFQK